MNRPAFHILRRRLIVNRFTQEVEDAAETLLTDRNGNGGARVHGLRAAGEAIRAAHGDASNDVIANMLRDLDNQLLLAAAHLNGVQQLRKLAGCKLDIQYRADDLDHGTDASFCHIVAPYQSHIARQCSAPATISVISCVIAP